MVNRELAEVLNKEQIKSFPENTVEKIDAAITLLKEHLGERIKYGQRTFLELGISTGRIVGRELGLDPASIAAAVLHDLSKYGHINISSLSTELGEEITALLLGLNRLASIPKGKTDDHSENFIKLLLSIAKDVRIILIQLADRLCHLRNITEIPNNEQLLLAREVFFLYAPVAHRLGLYMIKTELDEMAMKVLQPEIYMLIEAKLRESRTKQKVFIDEFIQPIAKRLMAQGFDVDIKGRPKSIPSIWNKMRKQNVDFEQVYDVFAVRIIINRTMENEKADCWKVYSIVTDIYTPNPERLRDWISAPKRSGYESLHTTVLGPHRRWVEVQIRSRRMDEVAEKGTAAHWMYKSGIESSETGKWLAGIREMLENPLTDPFALAHSSKMDLYTDKIFIFTPKGDLKKLESGSTVLDFAFEIHTTIGAKCTGAKVNGKNVPIKHELKNGDTVEILTSKNQSPKTDWLSIVKTSRAKSKIRKALNEQKFREADNGKEILQRKMRNWKIEFKDENIDRLIRHLKLKNAIDLYFGIATGKYDTNRLKEILSGSGEGAVATIPEIPDQKPTQASAKTSQAATDILMIDEKLDQVNYHLAKCCNPIFGDEVFGFITVSKGITIHRLSCPNAAALIKNYSYRIIRVQWRKSSGMTSYLATIKVVGLDELGIVNNITELISNDMKVNMRSISFDTSEGRFEGNIVVNVYDTLHLEALLRKLQKIKGVQKALRVK